MSGSYDTITTFVPGSGLQETLTGQKTLSATCYHSKVYTTGEPCEMQLPRGVQRGQVKRISFVHKGTDAATITIKCNCLRYGYSSIILSRKADQIELVWLGGTWSVVSTLNYEDFMSPSPVVA